MQRVLLSVQQLAIWLVVQMLVSNGAHHVVSPHPAANSILLKRPLEHITNFMLRELASDKNVGKNFVFSPLSIHLLMSLELAGLPSNEGSSIKAALGYDSKMSDKEILLIHESYEKLQDELRVIGGGSINEAQNESTFNMMTKLVSKKGAQVDAKFLKGLARHFNVSTYNVTDDDNSQKGLLESVAKWANRTGFDNPILEKKDLEGDFERLLLAVTHLKTYWLDPFRLDTKKHRFFNGGVRGQSLEVEFISNKNVVGSRLMRFAPPRVFSSSFDSLSVSQATRAPTSHRPSHLYTLKPKKYMKKDSWAKFSRWNFTALKIDLRDDFSLNIFMSSRKLGEDREPRKEDELIHKLIQDLISDQYALSQIFTELDTVDDPTMRVDYIRLPKFSFEYDIEFDELHGALKEFSTNKTKAGRTRIRTGIELTQEGARGAGSGHHREKRTAYEYAINEVYYVEEPFLFIVRYKKDMLICGKVTKLNKDSYKLPASR